MSYSEQDGQVTLTMSRDDYDKLLLIFGAATNYAIRGQGLVSVNLILGLLNRLNEGNPRYTPYQVSSAQVPDSH